MVQRVHHKYKIAFTIAFIVLFTAVSLNISEIYWQYDSGNDVGDLIGNTPIIISKIIKPYTFLDLDSDDEPEEDDSKPLFDSSKLFDLSSLTLTTEKERDYMLYTNNIFDKEAMAGLLYADSTKDMIKEYGADYNLMARLFMARDELSFRNKNIYLDELGITDKSIFASEFDLYNYVGSQSFSTKFASTGTDLGFSGELTKYLLPESAEEGQSGETEETGGSTGDSTGSAYKILLKWLTGNFVLNSNCINPWDTDSGFNLADDICFDIGSEETSTIVPICSDVADDAIITVTGNLALSTISCGSNGEGKGIAFICKSGTKIKSNTMSQGTALNLGGDNIIIKGCEFEGFDTAIKKLSDDALTLKNIEIIDNTFTNNKIAVSLPKMVNNIKDGITKPTLKIVGNEFNSQQYSKAIELTEFNGNFLLHKNNFKNSYIELLGKTDSTASATINLNRFDGPLINPSNYFTGTYIKMNNFKNAIILNNTFLKTVNGLDVTATPNINIIGNSFNAYICESSGTDDVCASSGSGVTGDVPKALGLFGIDYSMIQNNKFNDFNLAISAGNILSGIVNTIVIEKNKFLDNEQTVRMITKKNFVIDNDLRNNKGKTSSYYPNSVFFNSLSIDGGMFYGNKIDETKQESLIFAGTHYLYNVSDYAFFANTDKSSVYSYYPLRFDIKRVYDAVSDAADVGAEKIEEDLNYAQVEVKDVNNEFVLDITTPYSDADIYVYGFTKKKKSNSNKTQIYDNIKYPYAYSVYYGNDENGLRNKLVSGTISKLDSQVDITATFNDNCISPPIDHKLLYKQYDPLKISQYNVIKNTIYQVNPGTDDGQFTNYLVDKDTTFCSGLYEIHDGDTEQNMGVIQFADNNGLSTGSSESGDISSGVIADSGADGILTLKCDGTIFKGKELLDGKQATGAYIDKNKNVMIEGCTFKDYNRGILIEGSQGITITGNTLMQDDVGLQLNQKVVSVEPATDPANPADSDSVETLFQSQAIITYNTFNENKDWNILFIDPMHKILDTDNPSYIYKNKFFNLKGNNGNIHPTISLEQLEYTLAPTLNPDTPPTTTPLINPGFDDQIILYKDGTGNYWKDYANVIAKKGLYSKDSYVNYRDVYSAADQVGCTLNKPLAPVENNLGINACDGFYDYALPIRVKMSDNQYLEVLDKFSYSSENGIGSLPPLTASTVALSLNGFDELEATTTIPPAEKEANIASVSYNWFVLQKSITYLNLPINKLPLEVKSDGTEVNRLVDISGNDAEVSVFGDAVTVVDGKVGKALSLNGNGDYVRISDDINPMIIDGDFSLEMWFYYKGNYASSLFTNKISSDAGSANKNNLVVSIIPQDGQNYLYTYWNYDNDGKLLVNPNTGENYMSGIPRQIIQKNQWNYLAVVYSKTENTLKLYLNGNINDPKIKNYGTTVFGAMKGPFYINHFNNHLFKGMIDEYKIYNRALAPEQIVANYNAIIGAGSGADSGADSDVPSVAAGNPYESNNKIVAVQHGKCGDWNVKAWLTTKEGIVFSTSTLSSDYNSFLCGQTICYPATEFINPICTDPMKCKELIATTGIGAGSGTTGSGATGSGTTGSGTTDSGTTGSGATGSGTTPAIYTCQYDICTTDADCNAGLNGLAETEPGTGLTCAFGKCLNCVDLNNADDVLKYMPGREVAKDSVICKGTYQVAGTEANDGYIKIAKDNVGLMCQDGTEIIGTVENYDNSKTNIGIYMMEKKNVDIVNCNLSKFSSAVYSMQSENVILEDLGLRHNLNALDLKRTKNIDVEDNIVHDNIYGLNGYQLDGLSVYNSNIAENQFNMLLFADTKNIFVNSTYLNASKSMEDEYKKDGLSNADLFIKIAVPAEESMPIFDFYDTYYDSVVFKEQDPIIGTTNADGLAAANINTNANIYRYWPVDVYVVKSLDTSVVVKGASVEVNDKNDGTVDVDIDGVADDSDILFTDSEGKAFFYLLANVTDKNQAAAVNDINPYKVTAFKQGVGAKPAFSNPFTIKKPTIIELDLDTGAEFVIPPSIKTVDSSSSGSGGGGKGYSDLCIPEVDDKCKLKYDYTPCVNQGNLSYATKIFTCNSTNNCGTRLFVEPCEGNAPSYSSGCNNKVRDIFEEGVDCGGPCPKQCPATCADKKQNQDESDIDCGGLKCNKCLDNYRCSDDNDCVSSFCGNGKCKQALCYDNVKNQDEVEVDCGGSVCAPCGSEEEKKSTCDDGIRNQGETEVDCGGSCKACAGPVTEEPKGANLLWLLLLLLIPLIGGLGYFGYLQYEKSHKSSKLHKIGGIPAMGEQGLKAVGGKKGLDEIIPMNKGLAGKGLGSKIPSKSSGKIPPMAKHLAGKGLDKINDILPMDMKEEFGVEKEKKAEEIIKPSKSKIQVTKTIKALLESGKSKQQILDDMEKHGYSREKIEALFEESLHKILPKQHEEQLKTYINHYLSKGMTKSAIKAELLKAGWHRKIVDGLIK
ncbi:MAG: LamG-like jellyroll fold domain-containing protein [Candidatus Woesearchaeota archaeon]